MSILEKIRTVIIDDNQGFANSLRNELVNFPEVTLCGCASNYRQAKECLLNEKPDLAFLDVEMPGKNGFELLNEMRNKGCNFDVIFYTIYEKYTLQALRESAFDYILKPVAPEELKNVITRYKLRKDSMVSLRNTPSYPTTNYVSDLIALPSPLGLRFADRNRILLLRCIHESCKNKPCWEALLTDMTSIKLSANTSAERITQLLSKDQFLQISQSCIINSSYLNMIEFKTRRCILFHPFDNINLSISRAHLTKVREIYEVL